jgi:heme-degrading monooxygenase HmoA
VVASSLYLQASASEQMCCSQRQKEVLMFARTSSWSGSPEALDKWAEHVAAKVRPFVAGLPGNAGALFLIDRDAGSALTLTLWESEAAAEATDQNAEASRASTVAATGVEMLRRNRYELVARV